MLRCKATLVFDDGSRNFKPWSSNEDDTLAGTPSPNYLPTPTRGRLSSRHIKRASFPYMAGLLWHWSRTRDKPDTIRCLDHLPTLATKYG
ncbi:hypothetical protein TNCV_2354641 [Trichonephila clavipes]|nr:hypothetical protein TNCV_2354641 [Trichonephila clavipes]